MPSVIYLIFFFSSIGLAIWDARKPGEERKI